MTKTREICEKASEEVRWKGGQRVQRLNTDNKVEHEQRKKKTLNKQNMRSVEVNKQWECRNQG